jgi:hypothetical protein
MIEIKTFEAFPSTSAFAKSGHSDTVNIGNLTGS